MNEDKLKQVAKNRFNHDPRKPVPDELRRKIERTHAEQSDIPAESSLNRPKGMSRDEWWRRQRAIKQDIAQREKIRAEQEAEQVPESLTAKEKLVELAESRARRAHGPQKKYYERLASERIEQLQDHKQELAEKQRQEERRATVEGNKRYRSALENANAELRLSADDENRQREIANLKYELEKATPETVDSSADSYWEGMKGVYRNDKLSQLDQVVEADKEASEAVNKATEAHKLYLETQHRANMTKFE